MFPDLEAPENNLDEVFTRAKETYLYGKIDLFIWQKRPIYMAKETYLYGKRDLETAENNLDKVFTRAQNNEA